MTLCHANLRLPVAERRGYTGVFNALTRIVSEEGVLTLWRGCGPTIVRAMVVNAAQLASYSQAKQGLYSTGKCTRYELYSQVNARSMRL